MLHTIDRVNEVMPQKIAGDKLPCRLTEIIEHQRALTAEPTAFFGMTAIAAVSGIQPCRCRGGRRHTNLLMTGFHRVIFSGVSSLVAILVLIDSMAAAIRLHDLVASTRATHGVSHKVRTGSGEGKRVLSCVIVSESHAEL